jgi:hypothetical protein
MQVMIGSVCCFVLLTLAFLDDLCPQIVRKIQIYVVSQFDSSLCSYILPSIESAADYSHGGLGSLNIIMSRHEILRIPSQYS